MFEICSNHIIDPSGEQQFSHPRINSCTSVSVDPLRLLPVQATNSARNYQKNISGKKTTNVGNKNDNCNDIIRLLLRLLWQIAKNVTATSKQHVCRTKATPSQTRKLCWIKVRQKTNKRFVTIANSNRCSKSFVVLSKRPSVRSIGSNWIYSLQLKATFQVFLCFDRTQTDQTNPNSILRRHSERQMTVCSGQQTSKTRADSVL